MKRAGLLLCFAMFLGVGDARGQQSPNQQEGGGERTPVGPAGQEPESRAQRRGSGIVADNLDRVAATAEQILEVLNRDAGLMVELQRAIAQDAGASGQVLEQSDLNESAVTGRLREDLRTRVLATRLLQRYGYLLPKVNPDSDLAAERSLEMRVRAQQLERAADSHDSNRAAPQTEMAAGTPPPAERPANQGRSARSPLAEVDSALEYSRPEMLAAPPEMRLHLVKAGGRHRCRRSRRSAPGTPCLLKRLFRQSKRRPLRQRRLRNLNRYAWIGGRIHTRMCLRSTTLMYRQMRRTERQSGLAWRFSATARLTQTSCRWTYRLGPTISLGRAIVWPSISGAAFPSDSCGRGPRGAAGLA